MIEKKKKICDGCNTPQLIYKNKMIENVRHRLCKDCNFRKDLKLQPNKLQIKKKSEKQLLIDKVYKVKHKLFMIENPYCEAKLKGCTGIATEVHHKKGRGIHTNDVSTWCSVCRECHHTIHHVSPELARELNLLA